MNPENYNVNYKSVLPKEKHNSLSKSISKNAIKVLGRLTNYGYKAYLVGGSVRDLLLERKPKDFDIATNAHPDQIKKMFKNCRLIGKRFRLAHVIFFKEIIEVATFRSGNKSNDKSLQTIVSSTGQILFDNVFGTLEEDVFKRDFTVNAIYYDVMNFSLIDYVGGIKDLESKELRLIGNAQQRYKEDPVRMLRAILFANKLKFNMCPDTENPLNKLSYLLKYIPSSRLFEECIKLFFTGSGYDNYKSLIKYNLFAKLFPQTSVAIHGCNKIVVRNFIKNALKVIDEKVSLKKKVSPNFLLAVFLFP